MEIWIVSYEDWSLPVQVQWLEQSDVASVNLCPTVPLLGLQTKALKDRLSMLGEFRNESWWILKTVLNANGKKITGDPELFVVWRPIEARVKYRSGEQNKNRDEFFAEYARTGIINDPGKAEVVFISFQKHMISWMLNHQRPVDLGFCDLYPVPYRPNWKQLLLQRVQGLRAAGRLKHLTNRDMAQMTVEKMVKEGIADEMIDPKFLFWCKKDGHMYWSIEARPRSMWWRMVKAVEMAKKNKRHGALYLESVADTMKRCLPHSLELYVAHLHQISIPFVRLAKSFRSRAGVFVQRSKTNSVMCFPARHSSREPAQADYVEEKGTVLDDLSTDSFVSALSPVQRDRLAMRDAREDVDRATSERIRSRAGEADAESAVSATEARTDGVSL